MKKIIILSILSVVLGLNIQAQGKKDIVRNEVTKQTVYEYFLDEGSKDPVIEKVQIYDTLGNVIEVKDFNSEGLIKNWQRFEFDANGDLTREETLDAKGKVLEKVEMDYKSGLIREKRYFDKKGRLVKKKEYKYEFI